MGHDHGISELFELIAHQIGVKQGQLLFRVIRQKVTCTSVVVKSVTGVNADGDVVRFGIFIVSANPRGGGRYATIRCLCFRGSIRLSDCGRTCGEKKTQAQKNGGEKK